MIGALDAVTAAGKDDNSIMFGDIGWMSRHPEKKALQNDKRYDTCNYFKLRVRMV